MSRADRSTLPHSGSNAPVRFGPIHRAALPNGLRVWTMPHGTLPMVSLLLLVEAGSATDPADAHGLASITGDMLDEGSGTRSSIEIHDALARLGTQVETEVGSDATVLGMTVLARHLEPAMHLLGDILVRPRLAAADFERVRQLRLHRLRQLRDQPAALADRAFLARIYGSHPYGHLAVGSEESLQAITREDVASFHARAYDPRRATLIAVGAVTPDAMADQAARACGDWPPGESDGGARTGGATAVAAAARSIAIVPRPSAPQSEVRIGHVAVSRSTPDYHALLLVNMVLGGQFISRVNLNLREKKGYTYGVRTAFEFRKGPGPFLLQTAVETRVTADAVREAIGEIEGIRGPQPITAEELDIAQATLTRGYARNFETAEQIARAALQLALHNLPDDYFDTFVDCVNAVSPDAVISAAARHLDPARLATVIVGDADVIAGPLGEAGLADVEVIA